jgi:hypothetical protein
MDSSPAVEKDLHTYEFRCMMFDAPKSPSMYIIVKSFMWSLRMRELSIREHFQQMKRDEVTAFCFARYKEIDRRRLLFSWDNVRKW